MDEQHVDTVGAKVGERVLHRCDDMRPARVIVLDAVRGTIGRDDFVISCKSSRSDGLAASATPNRSSQR